MWELFLGPEDALLPNDDLLEILFDNYGKWDENCVKEVKVFKFFLGGFNIISDFI